MKKFVISLFFILIFILSAFYFINNEYQKLFLFKVNDFEKYENDFQIIANKMISINTLHDDAIIYIDYDNGKFICKLNKKDIELTNEEKSSLKNVTNAFDNSVTFNRIEIKKDRITFCTEGNNYAIVYMLTDVAPKFMIEPEEQFNIQTKRITKSWYHIARL